MSTAPNAPRGLGGVANGFWRRTVRDYELSDTELALLREVVRLIDECEGLQAAIAEHGSMVKGSQGQPRVNPALGELRQHRLALGRLLAQLGLKDDEGEVLPTPRTVTARAAARQRWANRGTA